MLGRNGCKIAYDETVCFESPERAEKVYNELKPALEELEAFKNGDISFTLNITSTEQESGEGVFVVIPSIRLSHTWKSDHIVRFVTDDSGKIGITIRPKKTPYVQVFEQA